VGVGGVLGSPPPPPPHAPAALTLDEVPDSSFDQGGSTDTRRSWRAKCREAIFPLSVTLSIVAIGMAYSLWWPPLVRHHTGYWVIPADIWLAVRNAHYVGWGGLSFVYSAHTYLAALPGFSVILWPIVTLSSALGLTESSPLVQLTEPHAWLLVGPFSMAMAGVALFALNALACRLDVPTRSRRLLTVAEGAAVWPTVSIWGHPEDVVALGLAVYALVFLLDRRWTGAGWLFGIAIAMQLYVIVLVPIIIGVIGWRRAVSVLTRSAVVPGFFLVAVLVPNFHNSITALLNQPSFPKPNHPTPWLLIAPRLSPYSVAGGPGRIIGLLVAIALAVPAYRWRGNPRAIVWLAAVVLGIRCLFEPVMVPYYVMPTVALALVSGVSRGRARWALTWAFGIGLIIMVDSHSGMWTYWCEMAGLMGVMLALAWPTSVPETAHVQDELATSLTLESQAPATIPG
jgi:hypothetical protein